MAAPVRRLPFVLLGLMTVAAFGGPVAFGLVLSGGPRPSWPPDRPVEWWTLGGISGLVFALMIACISIGLANGRAVHRGRSRRGGPDASDLETGAGTARGCEGG